MRSRLQRLLALSLSLLVLTDAESLSVVSLQALAQAAEEANAETEDTVQSSDEGQSTQDESTKGDSQELSTNVKGGDGDGEELADETEEEQPVASVVQAHSAQEDNEKPKLDSGPRERETNNNIEPVARQEPVKPAAGKADPTLALAQRKDESEAAPMRAVAAQARGGSQSVQVEAGAGDASFSPSRERPSVQSVGQPSDESTALLQMAVPNIVPPNVDTVSYLAESENQERIALTAESVAASAEASVAATSARVQKTKAFVEELRKSASAQGRNADKDERVQMSSGQVRSAQRELGTRVSTAKHAMTVAQQARLAALQLSSKVFPHVKFVSASTPLIQTYGPKTCISTWRDPKSGKCYLKTDCAQAPGYAEYDIGFKCEIEGQEPVEHRFGALFLAVQEMHLTSVACDRCLALQDEPILPANTLSTPASQTLLRGASAAPLD